LLNRIVVFPGLAIAIAVALAPTPARSEAVVDLVWFSTNNTSPSATAGIGTPILHAAPGDVVGLRLMLTADTEGLSYYGISVRFDDDGIDELNVQGDPEEFGLAHTITCTPFPSCFFNTPIMTPYTPGVEAVEESGPGTTGFVLTFEAQYSPGVGGVFDTFGPFRMGEIVFVVNDSVAADGVDIASGFFNPGIDAALDNVIGAYTTVQFGVASLERVADCQDRTDNDGDGEIDAIDPGCDDPNDVSEQSPLIDCDDGIDNDGDTLVDFGEDSGCASPGGPIEVGDEDSDGIADGADNCSLVANPAQIDSDSDSCGNLCDSDYNNDGFAGVPDFNAFRLAFGTTNGQLGYDPSIDHNADGIIAIPDHNWFRLGAGGPARPSGTTLGTIACP